MLKREEKGFKEQVNVKYKEEKQAPKKQESCFRETDRERERERLQRKTSKRSRMGQRKRERKCLKGQI